MYTYAGAPGPLSAPHHLHHREIALCHCQSAFIIADGNRASTKSTVTRAEGCNIILYVAFSSSYLHDCIFSALSMS